MRGRSSDLGLGSWFRSDLIARGRAHGGLHDERVEILHDVGGVDAADFGGDLPQRGVEEAMGVASFRGGRLVMKRRRWWLEGGGFGRGRGRKACG